MEKNYLSAEEAHKIATEVSRIDDVMQEIRKACENGLCRTLIKEMAQGDIEILRELGYKVVSAGSYQHVSW